MRPLVVIAYKHGDACACQWVRVVANEIGGMPRIAYFPQARTASDVLGFEHTSIIKTNDAHLQRWRDHNRNRRVYVFIIGVPAQDGRADVRLPARVTAQATQNLRKFMRALFTPRHCPKKSLTTAGN